MLTITSVEAQNRFGQLLDTVQREPVAVTRHGRPTAFLISPHEMEDVLDARRRRSQAVSELEAWSAQAAGRATPAAQAAARELTDADVVALVHEAR